MSTVPGAFARDENHVPITFPGLLVSKTLTTNASNTTSVNPIFTITGQVQVIQLYGIVTTTLGANQTAAYWRLNDQTAQVNISLNTGTTVSNAAVGSIIARRSIASVAIALANASAGAIQDPVAATAPAVFMPFNLVQKVGGVLTQIEYVYTTTTTPTSGEITFYCGWIPLTEGSSVTAA